MQVGVVGVAFSTTAIALHTFWVLVLRREAPPDRLALVILLLIWIFIILIVGLGFATHKGQDYYGDTIYWCWITENYGFDRIALEYFWLWLTVIINSICYAIMALVVKGVLHVDGMRFRYLGWKSKSRVRLGMVTDTDWGKTDREKSSAIAMQLLFYPMIYIITVIPMTVVRWMAFTNSSVPFPATAFASVAFSSSGIFNVILFALTRPKLLPQRELRTSRPFSFFGVGVESPQSTIFTRAYTPSGHLPLSWRSTSQTMPSEPPVLHITTQTRSSISV
jgi:hypothetical protein